MAGPYGGGGSGGGGWGSQDDWPEERGRGDDYGRDPYRRPASNSQRRYGPDEPTRPSSDWGGYGQRGPTSGGRGGYGSYEQPGGDTWGDYTESNTHWRGGSGPYGYSNRPEPERGPASMPRMQYGVPWDPQAQWGVASPALPRRRSHKRLWITLGVIAALLLLTCSGIGFVVAQYFGPAFQVGVFCGSMQTQAYTAGYGMLSGNLHGQLSVNDYINDARALDAVEGTVRNCATVSGSGGSSGYVYSLGGKTATVAVTFTRATAGALTGNIYLTNENGWKVDRLDASLLGVNLGALQTTTAYCTALQASSYTAAYALLGKSLTAHTTVDTYAQHGGWRDTVDGPVSACVVTALGTKNDESAASMTLSVTRGKLGAKKDALTLDIEDGSWKISAIGPALAGTDLGALDTATRFCADVKSANYQDLYGLLSKNAKGASSEADFAAAFSGAQDGIKWDDCTPVVSSFKLSGSNVTMTLTIKVTSLNTGVTNSGPVTFGFARNNNVWQLDSIKTS